ncbi:MAG: N-acetyltransferase [Saprospiraceae bacterium]|nr:N-acetyltransferase [Saprospiraceae bacterium]
MTLEIIKSELKEILHLRNLFLQETNFQIRYDACHVRGWTDSYLIVHNNKKIGYGSVKGYENINDRDTVFEFYLIPAFRKLSATIFFDLLKSAKANFIEVQSNDLLLTSLLYQFGQNINSNVILFEDSFTSAITMNAAVFRRRNDNDTVFEHTSEPVGDYVLEVDKQVLATGGFLLHYNIPFADLYIEVERTHRKKGLGSFLIQELKRQCYLDGRVPAARCYIDNVASRSTLTKADLKIAGFMLIGQTNLKLMQNSF